MSNIWAYEMLLPRSVRSDDVLRARVLAERRGYQPLNPVDDIVRVTTLDGSDSGDYATVAEAEAAVAVGGGNLQIWKGDVNLSLIVHPSRRESVDPAIDPAPEGWSRVTITADGSFFRDEALRAAVAADMWELFVNMCEQLGVAYGFSRDEDVVELFWEEQQRLRATVLAGGKPPLLFWLNYFQRAHFPWLDERMFSRAGGWVSSFPEGMLVSVFDVPWEVDLTVLQEVNRRWQGAELS